MHLSSLSARLAQSVERETLNLKVAGSVSLESRALNSNAPANCLVDPRIGLNSQNLGFFLPFFLNVIVRSFFAIPRLQE